MTIATSRVTSQGQISIPAEVRKRLGIGPGNVIEWDEEDGKILVRRVGRYTVEDLHRALFPDGPPERRSLGDLKEGVRQRIREKHARR